jgi:hypothetical protein
MSLRRVRFRVTADLDGVTICNCSICTKKGIWHLIVPPERFDLLQGASDLATYQFNTKVAKHHFCKVCGVHPFYVPRSDPDKIDVNAAASTVRRARHRAEALRRPQLGGGDASRTCHGDERIALDGEIRDGRHLSRSGSITRTPTSAGGVHASICALWSGAGRTICVCLGPISVRCSRRSSGSAGLCFRRPFHDIDFAARAHGRRAGDRHRRLR